MKLLTDDQNYGMKIVGRKALAYGSLLWAVALAAPCQFAQSVSSQTEIADVVKSPDALARYLKSSRSVNWQALRAALSVRFTDGWVAPCAGTFPAADEACSVEAIRAENPTQAILAIKGRDIAYTAESLRFVQDASGQWRCSGEVTVSERNAKSHHQLTRLGGKPYFTITSDRSQIGGGMQETVEQWFDLSLREFAPVFTHTLEGNESRWGFGIGRTIRSAAALTQSQGVEILTVKLNVRYDGVGLNQEGQYLAIYEWSANETKFTIRNAYFGFDRKSPMSLPDFESLSDLNGRTNNEILVRYALPGLRKIAAGKDADAKAWLRSILSRSADTPEKRELLNLLSHP
ncbi:MAG: hypothetical protein ABL995_02560 [Bryobacteraceae bacterium]